MAESNEREAKFLECTLCFENDDLKRLPCHPGHIFCVKCLTKDSELTKVVRCSLCRSVFEDEIGSLQSAGEQLDKFLCCDVCMRKEDKRELAQIYCKICRKKFCTTHEKAHNESLDDHARIRMDEYKKEFRKLETRYCQTHTDELYNIGCERCNNIYCEVCNFSQEIGTCTDGSTHKLFRLNTLVAKLIERANDIKLWVYEKEEHLLGMSKQLTAAISDWETETEAMIKQLHEARDKQINEITEKYAKLETELKEMRAKFKAEVTGFLDDEVGVMLDRISRQTLRIESRLFTYHQVDVTARYNETEDLIHQLIKMKIPALKKSDNHVKISTKECEEIQPAMELSVANDGFLIQPSPQQPGPPISMELIKTVKLNHGYSVVSVTTDGNTTFIGSDSHEVYETGPKSDEQTHLCYAGGRVESLQIYEDEVYVWAANKVRIFKKSGLLQRSWNAGSYCESLRVMNGKVVVSIGAESSLAVYSLTGQLVKKIPCPEISSGDISMSSLRGRHAKRRPCPEYISSNKSMAVCDDKTVIVTDYSTGSVFRVNIESGEVLWTSKKIAYPEGVVCYKNQYVLASSYSADTPIWILDINSGELLGKMTGEKGPTDNHFDLHIDEDVLMVTKYSGCSIQYYNLDVEQLVHQWSIGGSDL